jgi:uncharacterized protein YbgA (DUF1722 family)/uncharacterized protein YbbK (DUF523 family)
MASDTDRRIPVGVSSCLLGRAVRYDGGHKRDAYLVDVLGRYFDYLPFCPEVAIGMGTPRPPIRLTGDPSAPRAVGVDVEDLDVTGKLVDYARSVAAEAPPVSGYVFKSASPSCGMQRVKVYDGKGLARGTSSGLYAGAIMDALPLIPVEEESRLGDPCLRDSFVERVFVYERWRRLCDGGVTPSGLIDFHARHELLLLSHSEIHYRRLGRLIAEAGVRNVDVLAQEYIEDLMDGLKRRATRKRHTNVLQHIAGYLERAGDADDKAEIDKLIEDYRSGTVPLVVPIKRIDHHFRRHPDACVALQLYLNPHPAELELRNHL